MSDNSWSIFLGKVEQIVGPENLTIDEEQSGLYMIAAVCHHFDPLGSFTQLNIIKDTFGPKAK